ncbi:MAG TPA: SDR family oxidoreductase [Gemmatimonadaceae bacterium]|jgi:3-oxoacyl-[acyl-carrier protein] reductase|nr:SDR family oxidoreductase [Gemmatimonadaceae bacterium]
MPKPLAVVTGASRGIGRAIALRLCSEYDIVAVARSDDALESLALEIEQAGGACRPRTVDITDSDAVQAALGDIEAKVLVNNAGVGIIRPFMELTRAEWRQMIDVNVNALFDVTRTVLPGMLRLGPGGHVVMIGSIAGRSAFIGGTCYTATKAAVQALTESLMLELRESGIKVSVVNPGGVATDFGRDGFGDQGWKLKPEDVAETVARVLDTPPDVLIHRVEVRTLTVPKKK